MFSDILKRNWKKKILWYVFLSERLNDAVRNYSYNS